MNRHIRSIKQSLHCLKVNNKEVNQKLDQILEILNPTPPPVQEYIFDIFRWDSGKTVAELADELVFPLTITVNGVVETLNYDAGWDQNSTIDLHSAYADLLSTVPGLSATGFDEKVNIIFTDELTSLSVRIENSGGDHDDLLTFNNDGSNVTLSWFDQLGQFDVSSPKFYYNNGLEIPVGTPVPLSNFIL